ncbi:MAG: AI-2E family transporter [Solirubrobacterales bacterium]
METSIWARIFNLTVFDRKVARAVWIAVGILLLAWIVIALVDELARPLMWLFMAGFIATAASGPVNRLSRHMKRGAAIAIVYLGIALVPAIFGAILLPPLVSSTVDLAREGPSYVNDLQNTLDDNSTFRKLDRDFDIYEKLNEQASDLASNLGDSAGALADIGAGAVNSLFAGFTILVMSMFMLTSGRSWIDSLISRRPEEQQPALNRATNRIGSAIGAFLGGAIVQALIAGITAFIVLSILGIPSALALSALVALFDLIPMVGSTIAGIIVGVVTLIAGDLPIDIIVWAIFVIAYQQFENYVVQPQIQKRAVAVQPFVVLVAVLFGGTLMGVLGAIIAIPIAAALQIVVQEFGEFRREIEQEAAAEDVPDGATA